MILKTIMIQVLLQSSSVKYMVVCIGHLTYSHKSYGLLITFSLIMLDSPRLLLLLSTWLFWGMGMGRGDHPETFILKAL